MQFMCFMFVLHHKIQLRFYEYNIKKKKKQSMKVHCMCKCLNVSMVVFTPEHQ